VLPNRAGFFTEFFKRDVALAIAAPGHSLSRI
jgi:hypothetical protein